MLQHTFSHLKGVSKKTEALLWQSGIQNWADFLESPDVPLPQKRLRRLRDQLRDSQHALRNRNHQYFSGLLPPSEHWRLFGEFKARTAYIDIETTGLSSGFNEITTIALYDGQAIKYYINGHNLTAFLDDIRSYELMVTYNGKCFDIPFMAGYFRSSFDQSHIDLRYVLKNLGYSGGLKGCEKQFGLDRQELAGVNGCFAVLLWQEYKAKKHPKALETLLAYNIEDVVNLEFLMHQAYNQNVQTLPLAPRLCLEVPEKPPVPFAPDPDLIDQLKFRMQGGAWLSA